MILRKVEEEGMGFNNEIIKLNTLYFADDGLQVSQSLSEARQNVKKLIEVS